MVKITADSTCDLSREILDKLDITLVPLHILVDGKSFDDGINISPTDIFTFVEQDGKTCKTASVNVYEYKEIFSQYASEYDAIIHFSLGSQFSSCFQNASLAAQDYENVYVIDSENLSTGSGYLVYEAALLAKDGKTAEEICEVIYDSIPKIDASFVIDKLEYLYRGGRCSGLEVFGARLLQIKPSIEVIEGKMAVGKKYRGSFDRSLEHYVKDKLSDWENIDPTRVFLTNCSCSEETLKLVREVINQSGKFTEIIETDAGCTIASHCGPNALGVLFKRL